MQRPAKEGDPVKCWGSLQRRCTRRRSQGRGSLRDQEDGKRDGTQLEWKARRRGYEKEGLLQREGTLRSQTGKEARLKVGGIYGEMNLIGEGRQGDQKRGGRRKIEFMGVWRDLCKGTGQVKGRGLRIAGCGEERGRGKGAWPMGLRD